MFNNVKAEQLTCYVHKPKIAYTIPQGDALLVADSLWLMLKWIHNEFILDCEEMDESAHENEQFRVRNISRTISYVNQASLLEGILYRMYRDVVSVIQREIKKSITIDNAELATRVLEMAQVKEFRDAVTAHTAYADPHPKKDDVLSEINSLHAFLSTGVIGGNVSGFIVNVSHITAEGQASKRTIPTIGLQKLHAEMEAHFQSWSHMLVSTFEAIRDSLPIDTEDKQIIREIHKI